MLTVDASVVSDRIVVETGPKGTAWFSDDRVHRYLLTREHLNHAAGGTLLLIGLNPSTADAGKDDPTLVRMKGFARDKGFDTLLVANAFALRSRDPANLRNTPDPVGDLNDLVLGYLADHADLVLVAWGADPAIPRRELGLMQALQGRELWCLGRTGKGAPRHPLYLRRDAQLERWTP